MKLASLTVFSGDRSPILTEGWTFKQGRLEVLLPDFSDRDRLVYTDKVSLPINESPNQIKYDGFLYTRETHNGRIGTLYGEQKAEFNKKNISLLIAVDGDLDINKQQREDVHVKLMKRIDPVNNPDSVMIIVTFESEKGLELHVSKHGNRKTVQIIWDKKNELPEVRQVLPSLWSMFLKKLHIIFGAHFHPHRP